MLSYNPIDLHLFCVAHNRSGYKNKKRSQTLLFFALQALAIIVENIMYLQRPASDDGYNGDFGFEL